ncbi:MAG: hypothetical protein KKH88_04290 [Nanoarchaeota archaeon]|nr:hypothetical protein [Nanoarchaeota archaeon]
MNEDPIQQEYEHRICSRDARLVVEHFAETGVFPDEDNIARMLKMNEVIQGWYDAKFGDGAPVETKFWNLYVVFGGASGSYTPEDLVRDYLDN